MLLGPALSTTPGERERLSADERSQSAHSLSYDSRTARNQTSVNCGRGTMNLPPLSRYSFSRSRNSSRKCQGKTRK